MEYSMDAVARKMIQVILFLSALIAVGGIVFFRLPQALPFVTGVSMAAGVNVAKVFLLKKAVTDAVKKDAASAKVHIQATYFMRLMLTLAVLLAAALLPNDYVNLMGTVIAIFTLPISTYSMRYFFRHQLGEDIMTASVNMPSNSAQDAINEINAIVSEKEDE